MLPDHTVLRWYCFPLITRGFDCSMHLRVQAAIILTLCTQAAQSYNNGFGKTPALGWSSWYCAPGGSQVTDAFVRANAQALIDSGLAAAGYVFVNIDEGWLKGRFANGTIFEDGEKFPFGMKSLGSWVTSQHFPTPGGPPGSSNTSTLRYGLYSCRGTCQCSTSQYQGPGGYGHEAVDTDWMIDAGATWLKIDSCCGSQDHGVAYADYGRWRDAMNKSGVPVWFNLCGWNAWSVLWCFLYLFLQPIELYGAPYCLISFPSCCG